MPPLPVQVKVKVKRGLHRRTQRLGSHPKTRPYNPLCGKLKSNNSSLAKALSDQKQENSHLCRENLMLHAQVHSLSVSCNKRDVVLADIEKNGKQVLGMMMAMSESVSNIIQGCQEFTTRQDMGWPSAASTAKRESTRRLSTKSPARGVVKPMVSGHTITRPTINLSRISVNNLANLSLIEESPAVPAASPAITEGRTPPSAAASLNYEGRRGRRLPERIPLNLLRVDDDEEGRLSRRNSRLSGRFSGNNSGRLSGRISKRVSANSSARNSEEKSGKELTNGHVGRLSGNAYVEQLKSPMVALKDVSKLFRDSQTTINVRMLEQDSSDEDDETSTVINISSPVRSLQRTTLQTSKVIASCSRQGSKTLPQTKNKLPTASKSSSRKNNKKPADKKSNNTESNTWQDPMEGPSWLLDQPEQDPSLEDGTDENRDLGQDYTRFTNTKTVPKKQTHSKAGPEHKRPVYPPKPMDFMDMDDTMEFTECVNTAPQTQNSPLSRNNNQNLPLLNGFGEDEITKPFVTKRRGGLPMEEDDDTLIWGTKRPATNVSFDINDFELPVLTGPLPTRAKPVPEPEPEVTTVISRLTQDHLMLIPTTTPEQSFLERSGLQLPSIQDSVKLTDKVSPTKRKRLISQKRRVRRIYDSSSGSDESPSPKKKAPKKVAFVKDPSSAKVVLQKLNEKHVRKRSPSPEPCDLLAANHSSVLGSSIAGHSKEFDDSNSSNSMNSTLEMNRPRRNKAPINLKEPSLNTKLRREF